MRSILLVERSLLQARTIATMYETFDCEVTFASDMQGVVDALARSRIDVVIMSLNFCRESGVQTTAAVRAVRPELRMAVLAEPGDLDCRECHPADFHVRPTHFFSDLQRNLTLPWQSSAGSAPELTADAGVQPDVMASAWSAAANTTYS